MLNIFQAFDINILSKLDNYLKIPLSSFQNQLSDILTDSSPEFNKMLNYPYFKLGKHFRSILVLISTQIWNLNPNSKKYQAIIQIAISIEMIHVASLIHDDIYDRSFMRRGIKSYHTHWGELNAVLLGDFFFSQAFSLITNLENMLIIKNLSNTVQFLCKGELLQNLYKDNFNLRFIDYLKIIRYKTAFLIGESCRIGLIYLNHDKNYTELFYQLGLNLGMSFQIVDDYLDFKGDQQLGKPLMQDFFNGYISLPILYLFHGLNDTSKKKLIEKIKYLKKNRDYKTLNQILNEKNTLKKTMDLARKYLNRSLNLLKKMEKALPKDIFQFMEEFLIFTIERKF